MSNIVNGDSKYVKIDKSDTVIFSSKVIPGNEDKIERMQEKMIEQGATVITEEDALVHTTGHACREDLKRMYDLLKPAVVLPVHGDKKFIREHKKFALSCGIKEVFSARNGELCLLEDNHLSIVDVVPTDILAWDRNRPLSLGSEVIKNRRRIAYNCSMFISAVISKEKLCDLQVSSIDILEESDWQELSATIISEVWPLIERKLSETTNNSQIENYIRGQIRRRVYAATDVKPVTLLHVFYQKNNDTD